MLINLSKKEGRIRVVIGTILIAAGTHIFWYLLIPMGWMLVHTGITYKCPITDKLHRQTPAAKKHLFLNFLPRYNPQPVFIFKADSQLAYANSSAQELFPNLKVLQDLTTSDAQHLIEEEKTLHTTLTLQDRSIYSLLMRGSTELDGIVVYGSDITEVTELNQEIIETQKEIVYAMGEIGETRSKETGDHVRRVAEYSQLLALLAGINETEAELIKLASPMHDIGKVAIPDSILKKPGKLTYDEFEIMKTHSEIGFQLLNHSNRPVLKTASIIAHQHHEKWDGSGYPQKLSGENIHIYGRITAIADVFDALGSERVYKNAWPLDDIIALFKEQQAAHFAPFLVELFLKNLDRFLIIRERYPN